MIEIAFKDFEFLDTIIKKMVDMAKELETYTERIRFISMCIMYLNCRLGMNLTLDQFNESVQLYIDTHETKEDS